MGEDERVITQCSTLIAAMVLITHAHFEPTLRAILTPQLQKVLLRRHELRISESEDSKADERVSPQRALHEAIVEDSELKRSLLGALSDCALLKRHMQALIE